MPPPESPAGRRPVPESLREYGRGLAGGLLFSLPLLYTMEVWWTGFIVHPWTMIAYLATTFLLLLGYNHYAGMRHEATWAEVAIESVEEMGIGLIVAAGVLYLLGRITWEMPATEIVGKIVIEAMTVAIGVSVGTAQLGGSGDEDEQAKQDSPSDDADQDSGNASSSSNADQDDLAAQRQALRGELVIAFCGAVLFGSNVAPTEEILQIADEASAAKLLALAAFSIATAGLILFYIEFLKADPPSPERGTWVMVRHLGITYAIALAASALMLWFFQRFDGVSPGIAIAQTVVLAFPGVLGASAGRLLIR